MWRRSMRMLALGAACAAGPAAAQMFDHNAKPTPLDVTAHDATELFSHLCLSTHGNRDRAIGILGDGDSAIEKLDASDLAQLQGGKPGGVGWTIRMPFGERLIFEFTPDGTCIIRAPHVSQDALEEGFEQLLEGISASGSFKVHREGDDTRTIDKRKYHFITYSMRLPDTGQTAEVGVATTDARDSFIQGTLTFAVVAEKS